MSLSTQSYVIATEAAIISKCYTTNPITYPQEFNKDIAELFGYILMAGTISWTRMNCELNFADCAFFTEMPKRIIEIYTQHWGGYYLRKSSAGLPKICGKKNIAFIQKVFNGGENILPGREKVPEFVWESEPEVVKGFLKGVIGPCPKAMRFFGTWLAFRNPSFLNDIRTLLTTHTSITFRSQANFIILDSEELDSLKKELNLYHNSWWSSSTSLKLDKNYHE